MPRATGIPVLSFPAARIDHPAQPGGGGGEFGGGGTGRPRGAVAAAGAIPAVARCP
ncbi:hypothetical protein [Streptomyces sp. NPDC090025]|uniref:hypothetical protein n=1 Tax=Streptomyces sp. NPDC090025 TaxID=3365922 RepID=UPI00383609AF